MNRFHSRLGLACALTIACANAQEAHVADARQLPPFTLTWTQGMCEGCQTAKSLEEIHFLNAQEAWGIGEAPYVNADQGEYSIVHTRDGGKTWTEWSEGTGLYDPPAVSFANPNEGWVALRHERDGQLQMMGTRDGGSHWRQLPLNFNLPVASFFSFFGMQNLGEGRGYMQGLVMDSSFHSVVLATKDDGGQWTKSPLPDQFLATRMAFADRERGWMAGYVGSNVSVHATVDGGFHWTRTKVNVPPDQACESCGFIVVDLSVVNARNVWMLAVKVEPEDSTETPVSIVSHTSDGGVTWKNVLPANSPLTHAELTSVQFLDERIGFIAEREHTEDPEHGHRLDKGALLFTTDGGKTWQRTELAHSVWGCNRLDDGLMCVGAEGFRVLRIRPAGEAKAATP